MVVMNTSLTRFSANTGLALSVLIGLVSVIAFLSYPSPSLLKYPNPRSSLNITTLQPILGKSIWHMDQRTQEFLEISFAGRVDLVGGREKGESNAGTSGRKLWNWNTKQVFLWLEIEWEDEVSPRGQKSKHAIPASKTGIVGRIKRTNKAVVWDKIVTSKDEADVMISDANKYGVKIEGGKWSTVPACRFTLKWNVMPHVGLLSYGHEARTGEIEIPARVIKLEDGESAEEVMRMPY